MSKIKTFIIELLRNGHIESTHQVEMTTNKSEGQKFFPRSAIKPFQIIPLIKLANESNTYLTKEEIAIFGSSHSGQDIHTDLLQNICKKYEIRWEEIYCAPQRPMHINTADRYLENKKTFTKLNNNCSGKHISMLLFSKLLKVDNKNYQENNHFNIYPGDYTEEGDLIVKDDPIFGQVLKYYYDKVIFKQRIDIPGTNFGLTADFQDTLKGQISFMTCDSTSCIAEYIDFSFEIIYEKGVLKSVNYITEENKEVFTEIENAYPAEQEDSSKSIFLIFILGFLGGLAALLTPCVFPMIPLTVSFFTKGSEDRNKAIYNACLYGVFIFSTYTILSLPFHLMPNINPEVLNQISTNPWLNISFFVIFLVFAISFFGYFEITLPSSWSNKAGSGRDIGGIIGIFFMALTLAIVSSFEPISSKIALKLTISSLVMGRS